MSIEIAKLTRMLEAEKAALEGWGGLSDVEKAAYVAANPGSLVVAAYDVPNFNNVGEYHHKLAKKFGDMSSHTAKSGINKYHAAKMAGLHHMAAGHAYQAYHHYQANNGKHHNPSGPAQKHAALSNDYGKKATRYALKHNLGPMVDHDYNLDKSEE